MEKMKNSTVPYAPPALSVFEFRSKEGILSTSSQVDDYRERDFWNDVEE